MAEEAGRKLAESTAGLMLARFVTPTLLAVTVWLGSQYLGRLDEMIRLLSQRLDRQDQTIVDVSKQLAVLEAARQQASKARDSDFSDLIAKTTELTAKVDNAVVTVAAVAAKVDLMLSNPNFRPDVVP